MYNVVLQDYSPNGHYGNRHWRKFSDKETFQATQIKHNFIVVLEGISDDEVNDLLAAVPDVCLITQAIENACAQDDHLAEPSQSTLDYHLGLAYKAITANHAYRREYGILVNIPENLAEHLSHLSQGNPAKAKHMMAAIRLCEPNTGQLKITA